MAYGQWCPICGEPIISVTRGVPSVGLCANGHSTDRRDVLRRKPDTPDDAQAALDAHDREVRVRALREVLTKMVRPGEGDIRAHSKISYLNGYTHAQRDLLAIIEKETDHE